MLLGCSREPVDEYVIVPADIQPRTVKVLISENSPPSVVVEFDIPLISGCHSFHNADFMLEGQVCLIEVNVSYPDAADYCPASFEYYPVSVCLGRVDAGTYNLEINDKYYLQFEVKDNSPRTVYTLYQ